MSPKIEETIVLDFITSSPTTGAANDADSLPTAEVFEDSTDTTVYVLTCVKRTGKTGNYRVAIACTAANGFEVGKSYNVVASATVGTVSAKAVIGSFQVRANTADDVYSLIGASGANLTSVSLTTAERAAIAAAILITPGNKVLTDTSGFVTATNGGGSSDPNVALIKAQTDKMTFDATNHIRANVESYTAGMAPNTLLLVNPTNKLATDSAGSVTAAAVSLRSDAMDTIMVDGVAFLTVMKYIAAGLAGEIDYDAGTMSGTVKAISDNTTTRIQFTSDTQLLTRKGVVLTP